MAAPTTSVPSRTSSDSPQRTTQVAVPDSLENRSTSTIIAAGTVVGFILLGLTGLLLFLKISRSIRTRRDYRRFIEWNAQEHAGKHPKARAKGRHKGKNAFDIVEEDEGIPG